MLKENKFYPFIEKLFIPGMILPTVFYYLEWEFLFRMSLDILVVVFSVHAYHLYLKKIGRYKLPELKQPKETKTKQD